MKEPVTIKLFFGEFITGERLSGNYLDRMKDINVFVIVNGKQQPVIMKQLPDYWQGTFVPETEGSYAIIGINDQREVQDWTKHNLGITRPVQYLKTVYEVGTTASKDSPSIFLDALITKSAGNNYSIEVFRNNSLFASAKVTVTDTAGTEKLVALNKDGKGTFNLNGSGLFIIDVEWIDKTTGRFKDKDYASIRYKLDYSLYQTQAK